MGLSTKLIVSAVIAITGATLVSVIQTGAPFDPLLLVSFVVACIASALIAAGNSDSGGEPAAVTAPQPDSAPAATTGGPRETGKVKWFNVSKGFGFIIRDDGEEVFVHFRSIRGKGRRGLREGQAVTFVTVDSEKGPQAEDVEPAP